MTSRIVGIDFGSASVRAVEVSNPASDHPVIVRAHEVELPDGTVRRGEVLDVSTAAATIKRLWSAGGFRTRNVVLGMGGPRVLSRDLTVPLAPLDQIREGLPFHVQDLLPVPVGEAILDFYPISEDRSEAGPVLHGLLVAAVKEAVSANIAAATKAGLNAVQVDLIPFAISRALAPVSGAQGLDAVVSIGANTTNVIIVKNGVPQFVRIIPAGGDDITRAISSRLKIAVPQAEKLKREVGLGVAATRPEDRPVIDISYEIAGEQITAIRNTINFFLNTRPGTKLDRILLSGGGAELNGIDRAFSELVGVGVSSAVGLAGADRGRGSPRTPREERGSMTTAYGLALGVST